MFAQLGDIQFEGLKSPGSWAEAHGTTFGEIPHVGGKPSLQRTGEALVEIDISIRLSQDFCDVSESLEALKRAQANAVVLPFVTGTEVVIGKFVITSLKLQVERMTTDGDLMAAKIDLSLKEYVSPPGKKPREGQALLSNDARPMAQPPSMKAITEPQLIMQDIQQAGSNVSKTKGAIAQVRSGAKSIRQATREIKYMADTTTLLYTQAKDKVTATVKIAQRASQLPTSLDEAIAYGENLGKISDVTSMTEIEKRTAELSAGHEKIVKRAAPVAAFVATREGGI